MPVIVLTTSSVDVLDRQSRRPYGIARNPFEQIQRMPAESV